MRGAYLVSGIVLELLLPIMAIAADSTKFAQCPEWHDVQVQSMYHHGLSRVGFGLGENRNFGSSRISYQIDVFPFYWVRRQEVIRLSAAGPINVFAISLHAVADHLFWGGRDTCDLMNSPKMIFFLPNCSLRWNPIPAAQLALGLSTDYLLWRINGAHRGILFGPYLGIAFCTESRDPERCPTLYTLGVRIVHNSFLDFEGRDHDDGWSLSVSLMSSTWGFFD